MDMELGLFRQGTSKKGMTQRHLKEIENYDLYRHNSSWGLLTT